MRHTLPTLVVLALISLGAASLPAAASAASSESSVPEESPKWLTTGMDFGAFWLNDENIQSTYSGSGKFVTRLTVGFVPWSRYIHIELAGRIGFLQFLGSQSFVATGEGSADKVMMTIFPINVDLTVGVDIVHEQPIVPYGGIGFAATLWREHETGGGDEWTGDRLGYNVFFGGRFLLDAVDKNRAALLDITTGINDAFITVEGRWADVKTQFQDGEPTTDGLGFGGWSIHAGLLLAY